MELLLFFSVILNLTLVGCCFYANGQLDARKEIAKDKV